MSEANPMGDFSIDIEYRRNYACVMGKMCLAIDLTTYDSNPDQMQIGSGESDEEATKDLCKKLLEDKIYNHEEICYFLLSDRNAEFDGRNGV